MTLNRSELWLADLGPPLGDEQGGRRPVLVISGEGHNSSGLGVIVVVPLTTRRRGWNTHVEVATGGTGLDRISWAKCEDIRSVSDQRMIRRLGSAPETVLAEVERVLRHLLEF